MLSRRHRCLSYSISKILHILNGGHCGTFYSGLHLVVIPTTTRFCAERLQSLVRTLELNRIDEYSALQKVASFATLVATYEKGKPTYFRPHASDCARRLPLDTGAIRDG